MVILVKKFYYSAIAIWPFVIIREDDYSIQLLNHECVHLEQQKEMLFVFAYLWYIVEYLIKLAYYRNRRKAYRAISFEREAIAAEQIIGYLGYRKRYTWLKFLYIKDKGGKYYNPNKAKK